MQVTPSVIVILAAFKKVLEDEQDVHARTIYSLSALPESTVYYIINKIVEAGWIQLVREVAGVKGKPRKYYQWTESGLALINAEPLKSRITRISLLRR